MNGDNNPFDDNGHGTHVAGTIGALGSNSVGVTGVNWQTKVVALKFLDWFGSGTTADAVSAILYAAAKGADSEQLVGRRRLLADARERDRDRRPGGLALRRGGRQRRREQRCHAVLPRRLRGGQRRLGGGHELEGPAGVVLQLRGEDGRPRRARRLHLLDHPGQPVRLVRRHVDGHTTRLRCRCARQGSRSGGDRRRAEGAALRHRRSDLRSRRQVRDRRAAECGEGGQVLADAAAPAGGAATGLPGIGRGRRSSCGRSARTARTPAARR